MPIRTETGMRSWVCSVVVGHPCRVLNGTGMLAKYMAEAPVKGNYNEEELELWKHVAARVLAAMFQPLPAGAILKKVGAAAENAAGAADALVDEYRRRR